MVLFKSRTIGLAGVRSKAAPLPMREGVGASLLWIPEGRWENMLAFLATWFVDVDTEIWVSRMAKGEVVDANGVRLGPDSPVKRGMCIYYYREIEDETSIPFQEQILYRDEHLLVVDKPHFLPVIPGGRFLHETLLVRLKKKLSLEDLVPLHRLDRETAGLVMFSCNPVTRGEYQKLFRDRAIDKVYEALAPISPIHDFPMTYRSRLEKGIPFFCMREINGAPNAETRIELLEAREGIGHYRLHPITGKQHQLRVHLAALGIPILNDEFYPVARPCKGDDYSNPLQLLARGLSFTDPVTREMRVFESDRILDQNANREIES